MEILAPAGSREALERAQAAGADAVYLGFSAFSARAGAGNFNEEELDDAIRFAHLHHMRVYVTVNTLVRDDELPAVREVLRMLDRQRADGILVQDLGILRVLRSGFPGLRIHASTQMAIHNETGVRWCAGMGMKRVVLARECSLEEIRKCASAGAEIEVFGHGAQCVSVSGECLFSSMVGERSGNRGRCAQPCRKRYRLEGQEGAWLSPRDLCLRDRLPELAGTGAASLKIEGRLKRPEYVYTVTKSYRRGMDSLDRGAFRPADEAEREGLMQAFHRGGFMEGYAFGAEDAGVIYPEEVNHQGIPMGVVTESRDGMARVLADRTLHDGDGLRIFHGNRAGDLIYSGKEVPAGGTAQVYLRDGLRAGKGDRVVRLTDARQAEEARAAEIPKIPADLRMEAWPGQPLKLWLSDGENEITVSGETVQAARTRETSGEEMERQLAKTGGTAFEARQVSVRTAGAFVPLSAVNELRREGLRQLAERRIGRFAFPEGPEEAPEAEEAPAAEQAPEEAPEKAFPGLVITVRDSGQAEACRGEGRLVIHYPEDFREAALDALAREMRPGEWLRIPDVCEEVTLRAIGRWTEKNRERLGGVVLGSVGQLGLDWQVPVAAGPGIPVMNREAARLLKEQGCVFVTVSPELTGEETRRLTRPGTGLPVMVLPVYGRTQLMLLHHCPARTVLGGNRGHAACRLCDEEDGRALKGKKLEDERGYRFPLLRVRLPEGCLVRLLNKAPVDLGDQDTGLPRAAEMTTETAEEAAETAALISAYQKTPGESTRGHWHRAVL